MQTTTSNPASVRQAEIKQKLLDKVLDMLCALDDQGRFVYVSAACEAVIGYTPQELQDQPFYKFLHPEDVGLTQKIFQELKTGIQTTSFENNYLHKAGCEIPLTWSARWSEDDQLLYCVGRDATEQKQVYYKLREVDELHRALVQYGTDLMSLLNEKGQFIYSIGAPFKKLGYDHQEVMGQHVLSFVHPEDQSMAQAALEELVQGTAPVTLPEVRFRTADGTWEWFEVTGSNQLTHPHIQALVLNARLITEKVAARQQMQESEEHFRSLFDHNPDMVLFEDPQGIILDVNPAFLAFCQREKAELVNHALGDFLPMETLAAGESTRRQALQGQHVRFEMDITLPTLGRKHLDITKIPVLVDQEVVGIYCIAKDITAITQSHETIQQQAQKLHTIFESITDAFLTIDPDWHLTYINNEAERLLQMNREQHLGCKIWDIFPEEDQSAFYHHFLDATIQRQAVHFEAHLQCLDLWLETKIFPSEEGLSVYLSDITEKVKNKLELEKLSLVASQTDIGVIITDKDRRIEWVNAGFTRNTGYTFAEAAGQIPSDLLHLPGSDAGAFETVLKEMQAGQPVHFEILNRKKNGDEGWNSVQVNPIRNQQGEIVHFVATQTDITALKKSEMALSELTRDLSRQNRDLQQFSYIVSHNLRAPVANAKGLVDLLTAVDKHSEIFRLSLANLKTSVLQLDTVLSDLTMILSIRDKNEMLDSELVDLSEKCHQALDSHQQALTVCLARVYLDLPEGLRVRGHNAYVYSIFYNLISNAIKYRSPDRFLEINIDLQEQTDGGSVITFSDNGRGFDMETVGPQLFKLYKRFHTGTEGRGIGLFLVKTQMEALGGKIAVTSQVDVGTRFTLYFK